MQAREGRGVKKALLFLFLAVLLNGILLAEDLRFQLAFCGGFSHIFEYGSEKDYVQGVNDFPVTPAHTPPFFCLSLSYSLTDTLKLELDGRHVFGSNVSLIDPSDADSVDIATVPQSFLSLDICYQCIRCNFRPYFLVGGGLNRTAARERSYTTEYGYEIGFSSSDKRTALMFQMGWGLDLAILRVLGVRADVRFFYVFEKEDNIPMLFVGVGAYYLF